MSKVHTQISGFGGAIKNDSVTLTLRQCTLSGNSARGPGGAIFNIGPGRLLLTQCTLSGNSASGPGGAIYESSGGELTLENCTLSGNSASDGGAIFNFNNVLTLKQCTVSGNYARQHGGAILNLDHATLTLEHCTLSSNFARSQIGNLGGTVDLRNSIVAGNTATGANNGMDIYNSGTVNRVGANLIQVLVNVGRGEARGPAALSFPPILRALNFYGGPTKTMPPMPGSRAIDAAVGSFATSDQRGFPRPLGAGPDLGAVEEPVEPFSLKVTSQAADGVGSLRFAATYATSGSVITFAPHLSGQTLLLNNGEIVLAQDVTLDASSLPGGLTLSGGGSNRLFTVSSNQSVSLIGLTLTGGNTRGNGGAILCLGRRLTLKQCTLSSNTASLLGGAICGSSDGTLKLEHCTLSGNSARDLGGAIYETSGGTLTLEHCTVSGNSAGSRGGAISNRGGTVDLRNSIVAGNTVKAVNSGADIFNSGTIHGVDVNFIGNLTSSGLTPGATVLTTDRNGPINLAPLGTYGGPTMTMALQPGSPARNAATGSSSISDQRGFPIVGTADIGAYEAQFGPLAAAATLEDTATGDLAFTVGNVGTLSASPGTAIFGGSGANRTLRLTPAANVNGPVVVAVTDSLTGETQTFTLSVNSVNDAPVRTAGMVAPLTINEDLAPITLGLGGLSYGSGGGADEVGQTLTYKVTDVPAASLGNIRLADGTTVVSANTSYELTEIRGLKFAATANANGSGTFSYSVTDSGGTANGGVNTMTESIAITVNPVNDAPSYIKGADRTVTTNPGPQSVPGWATDIRAGPADERGQTLSFNVTSTNKGLFATQPAISPAGTLTFTPAADASGTATVSVSLSDNGGTANGGVNTSAAQTFTLTVRGTPSVVVTNDANSGPGSLRAAVATAAANPGPDLITFAPALSGQTLLLNRGEIVLTSDVTLDASSLPDGLTLSGGGSNRLFSVNSGVSVAMQNLTLKGGNGAGVATTGAGGAVFGSTGSTLTLTRCTFTTNTGSEQGGAVFTFGALTAEQCTFSGNSGTYGGAVQCNGTASSLTQCTLSGNRAGFGGGIYNKLTTLTLRHCIVAGNTASSFGADILNEDATLACVDANLVQGITSFGTGKVTGPIPNSLFPRLAPLDNYGGPTMTMALRPGSPARDAAVGSTLIADQRGFPLVGVPDLGAYEAGTLNNFNAWVWELLPANSTVAQHAPDFDFDGDGLSNVEEFTAGTTPLVRGILPVGGDGGDGVSHAGKFAIGNYPFATDNPNLPFEISVVRHTDGSLTISFPTVTGRTYTLLQANTPAAVFVSAGVATVAGNGATRSFTVTPPANLAARFYRVSVSP